MKKTAKDETKRPRVYQYGLLPPVVGADIVIEQMRRARRYSNQLVEIEIGRRDALRLAESQSVSMADAARRLEVARRARDAAIDAIKAERSKTRVRVTGDEPKAVLVAARAEYKAALNAFNEGSLEARRGVRAGSRRHHPRSRRVQGAERGPGEQAARSEHHLSPLRSGTAAQAREVGS